jgi:transposase-like protein
MNTPTNGTRNPEVTERAARRRHPAEYKARILEQYERLPNGERGALLRREGLYSSHIDAWRKLRNGGGLSALSGKKPGRPRKERNPLQKEVDRLQREKARLEKKLQRAEAIIEIQKKVAAALDALEAEESDNEGGSKS